ncbi:MULTISPECIES: glycosyltransferase family 4 protein [Bradyrhizobium]|uniref:glycosyltransferase family 4 protein n=1 Tax=Bradyrhizobium TaxID=374 RepID=UPI00160004AB|nr:MULTISPECIES: glycosyltransferase family 4 protein [Bradyrhizobium]MDA9536072.1 glycosyl transferase [Bradyrhizobium sp. CCBAU 21362]
MDFRSTGKRRILYVANVDFAFLHRLPMARAARAAGFEVHVATRISGLRQVIESENFTLHEIPFRRGLSPFSGIRTIMALRRLESYVKPDIIHCASLQSCVYGSLAMRYRRVSQVNAITGLGYIFTSSTWKSRILRATIRLVLPALLNRNTSVVLVENPDDQSDLVALGVNQERILHIPGSGVDTDHFQPLPEPEGPITFGFAGRLLSDKGIRALVSAHKMLRDQGHDFRLLIAGKPDPANPASIPIEEVEEWTRRPGITWLGHLDDIVALWTRCHVAVLPSHREGLPVSLLEAAACGRAMVATNAPGCREIVVQNETGRLVPVEDAKALADALLSLALSPELRSRYGRTAREMVVQRLSSKIVGEAIIDVYNRLAPRLVFQFGGQVPQ